ncbi:hypothetical protein M441DRAFT_397021 [Trichoderma asperellum CBS 433.97]|uniref:Uncharacterized protein n=1 Tax=Trichoderma asperellum (strain ATCC 204424 / CBS 433.97 / NBRC 101777) TaxID=1042311 RepID=A0A2T3Z996_TRIA4|nr:hypothetical protein M441DRAFT_397021 [Trichoderma asperellum CBS 433.97]PTB41352.1 hypothetical protein M441DRAFT_397021 [Trichoderma asperellum CBS 433.97]
MGREKNLYKRAKDEECQGCVTFNLVLVAVVIWALRLGGGGWRRRRRGKPNQPRIAKIKNKRSQPPAVLVVCATSPPREAAHLCQCLLVSCLG